MEKGHFFMSLEHYGVISYDIKNCCTFPFFPGKAAVSAIV